MADLPPSTTVTSPLLSPPSTKPPSPTSKRFLTTITFFLHLLTKTPSFFCKIVNRLLNFHDYYGYSFPTVMIITLWNLTFVVVTIATLISTLIEKPNVPLRVCLIGNSLHRLLLVCLLLLEYKRRQNVNSTNSTFIRLRFLNRLGEFNSFIVKILWCLSSMWMSSGGETLEHDAPRLLWLTKAVLFPELILCLLDLLFDDFRSFLLDFPVFQQRRALPADISRLPKYGFEVSYDENQPAGRMVPWGTNSSAFSSVCVLQVEDSGCCICYCKYEHGAQLNSLPCKHHFHAACLLKWLTTKATCPLCKKVVHRVRC